MGTDYDIMETMTILTGYHGNKGCKVERKQRQSRAKKLSHYRRRSLWAVTGHQNKSNQKVIVRGATEVTL
jgi:hypothetical protein